MFEKIKKELCEYSSAERKKINEYFFKTGKGEYGEGDKFIGVSMPDIRKVAKKFLETDFETLKKLLLSKIHEERMLAGIILTYRFEKNPKEQKKIFDFYVQNFAGINNWDLVDVTVPNIIGSWVLENAEERKLLNKWVESKNLWERRASILATFTFIKQEKFSETFKIAKKLLGDKEDLIHKAVGWMLREVWKKNEEGAQKCEAFLRQNYQKIPRTTLRYAIEKMPEKKRKKILKGKFNY